ncbi:MAG TPA: 3-dehydroquinate synthase [Alphaproteobacteria bacterium]|nr:3-dehydroquinate synthase [Rhodospirillaceae bacterium]HRJ12097.1 3-dehydroquinate synthase [Alphaproteobacteria bacterium]
MTKPIHIKLTGHAYDIHIGAGMLASVGALTKSFAPPRVFIVTDENCAQHYVMPLIASLRAAAIDMAPPIVVPAGEASKSFAEMETVMRALMRGGADRHSMIIALGGGVLGDLAGFVAATALRGIRFVQMPTTLLAQVDSSVGGKTGINLPEGKNLVGAFHHPSLVVIDPDVLQTLSRRELLAGYAEIVKYGLINDAEFYGWCENNGEKLLALDADALTYAIHRSCANKAKIVEQDPEEQTGLRALLNLGHTFAHAYEALAGYSGALLHGEAVALGLIKAAQLSAHLGFCSGGIATRVAAHLGHVGMPTDPKFYGDFKADDVIARMRADKKNSGGKMNLILLKGIGEAFVEKSVDENAVRAVL